MSLEEEAEKCHFYCYHQLTFSIEYERHEILEHLILTLINDVLNLVSREATQFLASNSFAFVK